MTDYNQNQIMLPGLPPPTIGERPLIGRQAQPEEAPLFSLAARMPDEEQITLDA